MLLNSELRTRSLISGLLSYILGLYNWWDNRRPTGHTASSNYCKSIWEFHRGNYIDATHGQRPSTVAELGPGASLGTCLAALCDGIEYAVGLDVCPYAEEDILNKLMLEELWPKSDRNPRRQELVVAINQLGKKNATRPPLEYVAPWTNPEALPEASVDMVFSHSVLEHVDNPAEAYRACFKWLRPGGIMSHKIDHSSHGLTISWNGHYALPAWTWKLIRGGRPYLLNRLTPSEHRKLILLAGFEILSETLVETTDIDHNSKYISKIRESDTHIKTSTFICKKNN